MPSLIFAAGFAKQSLFLSKSPVTEGDAVRIYAVLSNNATSSFSGTVVIADGDADIGSASVSIPAGGTQTVSVSWKPSAGQHPVTAKLTAGDGTVVESESETFSVSAKPSPVSTTTPPAATGVESSQNIQNQIGALSPTAEAISKPLFTTFDNLRATMATFIDDQLAGTKAKLGSAPGIVEGAQTGEITQNPGGTFWTVLYTVYLYILTVLRFLIGNAGVFYPVLVIIFFYALWRSYKHFSRPAWER